MDVFGQEPIPLEHPLLKAPNTVLSPHIGYVTREVYQAWYEAAVEGIRAYAAGAPLRILQPHLGRRGASKRPGGFRD